MLEENKKDGYSILVTAFNVSNFLEECLDSIANQTYFKKKDNYEVLIGIDGCNDTLEKTLKIKDKYSKHFMFYFMKENKGTYVTTNTLLSNSIYNKIVRFDSDDIMFPKMIEKIDSNILDFDCLKFKAAEFVDNINKFKISSTPLDGVCCYKRGVFDIFGGYKSWRTSADSDFLFRTRQFIKEKSIPHCLYYRRIHSNSLTQNPDTGYNSKQREEYRKKLKYHYDKIEYVEPEINKNFELL